jgi:inner membrane protease subunit 1
MGLIKGKVIAKVLPWKEGTWFENGLVPVENEEDVDVSL